MAIIVPILLSYTGAAAAIGTAIGISATAVTAVASLAFQVSGINNKINKAASKVFGEDLVMIANIAGAVYGAVNGGFDFGSGAENASSALAVNGSDLASDLFSASNAADLAAGGAGLASDGLGGIYGGADALTNPSSALSVNGLDSASETFNLADKAAGGGLASDGVGIAASTPDTSQGMDLLKGTQTTGTDTKALVEATKTGQSTGAARDITAAPTDQSMATKPAAAASDAGSAKASGNVETKTPTTTKPPTTTTTKPPTTTATKPGSFFDKLLNSEKGMGAVVQGVGGALSSAAQGKSQKEALDFAKRKYHSVSGVRVA